MKYIKTVYDLPSVPSIYALCGGREKKYIAYVGNTKDLKNRIQQHLIGRDSSIATGTSTVGLNPDYVTEVRWWEHPKFEIKDHRLAAELVAFDVFNPALRSRSSRKKEAKKLYTNEDFRKEMEKLFKKDVSGILELQTFDDLLKKIDDLEARIKKIESG